MYTRFVDSNFELLLSLTVFDLVFYARIVYFILECGIKKEWLVHLVSVFFMHSLVIYFN